MGTVARTWCDSSKFAIAVNKTGIASKAANASCASDGSSMITAGGGNDGPLAAAEVANAADAWEPTRFMKWQAAAFPLSSPIANLKL